MFIDEAKIQIIAGKGGNGCVHFRREKYIPKGGPDGGNGGTGGNIIVQGVTDTHTLSDYRRQKKYKAQNGINGEKNNMTGKNGQDLILKIPLGTQIRDQKTNRILADITKKNQTVKLAHGGIGGKGNAGFVSSVRQAPNFAEKGDTGEEFDIILDLKLIADVAIIGYPSVGKSTLISVISNAKPKIADYPFTTLIPNLGIAKTDDREITFIDVPGLIEGASEGKGLGHRFLRHIERAHIVLHLIDATSDTPLKDYEIVQEELKKFSPILAKKPSIPAFSKIDLTDQELEDFLIKEFMNKFSIQPIKLSAATHEGIKEMLRTVAKKIPKNTDEEEIEILETTEATEQQKTSSKTSEEVLFKPENKTDSREIKIEKSPNWWTIRNKRLEQMVRQTDIEHPEARQRIYNVLKKWNIFGKLEKQGATKENKIRIGETIWEMR